MASFNITAGLVCFHAIRGAVKLARVKGHSLTLFEGPGWIEREFRIEGAPEGVGLVRLLLAKWARETGQDEAVGRCLPPLHREA